MEEIIPQLSRFSPLPSKAYVLQTEDQLFLSQFHIRVELVNIYGMGWGYLCNGITTHTPCSSGRDFLQTPSVKAGQAEEKSLWNILPSEVRSAFSLPPDLSEGL